MLYSHELCSTTAKYTVQLGQSNNFLYTVSYQQIKTWSLLSEGYQSKSWEKVWANLYCLSLVTSHVVGTSRAQHTTSYMSYKQRKTLSSFTTRQQIQVLKKSVTSVFFVRSLLMPLAPVEQSIQLLIGVEQQQIEALLSLTTRQFLQWKFIYIHIFRQSI